jgi:hypothetical protein
LQSQGKNLYAMLSQIVRRDIQHHFEPIQFSAFSAILATHGGAAIATVGGRILAMAFPS